MLGFYKNKKIELHEKFLRELFENLKDLAIEVENLKNEVIALKSGK